MRILDAHPGDVLRDKDGDLWLRGERNARVLTDSGTGDEDSQFEAFSVPLDDVEKHGPFTRLAPEKETP
jgi:hypothetical protein